MSFHVFQLSPEVMKSIDALNFAQPTPVQAQVIPEALNGRDIRACAQTGTGKTCAFAIPILERLHKNPMPNQIQVLVLVPTRELGQQVVSVFKEVGQFTPVQSALIMGGADFQKQVRQIRAGARIVVATPGRLLDHLQRRTFHLGKIETLVLDEADRMLDMGFLPDIRRILSQLPPERQTMLFSATFPPEIVHLGERMLNDPVKIEIAPSRPADTITQVLYPVSRSQKQKLFDALLDFTHFESALVFCRTKHGADLLAAHLKKLGRNVGVIHSNFSQPMREKALKNFKEKKTQFLVATDIASRGLDIKDISHVINFDVPEHADDYVHRIGRTGRAEATGDAITLMAPDEEPYIRRIEAMMGKPIPRQALPDFPYLVPPRLTTKPKKAHEMFGRLKRRIPTGGSRRFRR